MNKNYLQFLAGTLVGNEHIDKSRNDKYSFPMVSADNVHAVLSNQTIENHLDNQPEHNHVYKELEKEPTNSSIYLNIQQDKKYSQQYDYIEKPICPQRHQIKPNSMHKDVYRELEIQAPLSKASSSSNNQQYTILQAGLQEQYEQLNQHCPQNISHNISQNKKFLNTTLTVKPDSKHCPGQTDSLSGLYQPLDNIGPKYLPEDQNLRKENCVDLSENDKGQQYAELQTTFQETYQALNNFSCEKQKNYTLQDLEIDM